MTHNVAYHLASSNFYSIYQQPSDIEAYHMKNTKLVPSQVCQHPHIRMREWGVEAITYLVQAAFQYHHNNPVLVTEVSRVQPYSVFL